MKYISTLFIFFTISNDFFQGDHPATAKAIAKSVGILGHDQDPVERTALLKPAESCLITGMFSQKKIFRISF